LYGHTLSNEWAQFGHLAQSPDPLQSMAGRSGVPREGQLHVNYVPNAPTAFNRDSHQSTNTFVHEPSSLSSKWARIPEGFVASDSDIGSELDYSTILAAAASG
jgi:hypothetical protein